MSLALVTITVLSLILAAACAAIAWRVVREDRRRSEARVAALVSEIGEEPLDLSLPESEPTPASMFAVAEPQGRSRVIIFAGAALVVVAAAVAGALVASGREDSETAPSARELAPLELVDLAHEQDRDRLTVHGVVRGPGIEAPYPLAAVVTLLRGDGSVITTERAIVAPVIAPRRETSFHVTVSGALQAARFRVSFADADRVIPHLDRRS